MLSPSVAAMWPITSLTLQNTTDRISLAAWKLVNLVNRQKIDLSFTSLCCTTRWCGAVGVYQSSDAGSTKSSKAKRDAPKPDSSQRLIRTWCWVLCRKEKSRTYLPLPKETRLGYWVVGWLLYTQHILLLVWVAKYCAPEIVGHKFWRETETRETYKELFFGKTWPKFAVYGFPSLATFTGRMRWWRT